MGVAADEVTVEGVGGRVRDGTPVQTELYSEARNDAVSQVPENEIK